MHIVVETEKMVTEICHRKSLRGIQLNSIRNYLTGLDRVK